MNEGMQGQPVPHVLGTDRPYPVDCKKMLEEAGNICASCVQLLNKLLNKEK